MSFDLALSEHGDLIFAANKDLEFVEGIQVINQRIITRLRIKRGSWIFNRDSSLGSDLDSVMGRSQDQQLGNIPGIISEALAPMEDEIDIHEINVSVDGEQVMANIAFSLVIPNVPPDVSSQNIVQLLIPIAGVTT